MKVQAFLDEVDHLHSTIINSETYAHIKLSDDIFLKPFITELYKLTQINNKHHLLPKEIRDRATLSSLEYVKKLLKSDNNQRTNIRSSTILANLSYLMDLCVNAPQVSRCFDNLLARYNKNRITYNPGEFSYEIKKCDSSYSIEKVSYQKKSIGNEALLSSNTLPAYNENLQNRGFFSEFSTIDPSLGQNLDFMLPDQENEKLDGFSFKGITN